MAGISKANGEALEAAKFAKKHRLIRDETIKDRYYLTKARDRWIDMDLTDPEVREKAEAAIREFRTDIVVRKDKRKGQERARDGDALFNVEEAHRMFSLGGKDVQGVPGFGLKNTGRKVRR